MGDEKAPLLAEQIMNLFSLNPFYFTNARFEDKPWTPDNRHALSGYTSIAEPRTFAAGLIFLDAQRIGLFWATAED
jgi:hypothetical protein